MQKEMDEIEMRKVEHTKELLSIPCEQRTEKQLLELMSFTKKFHLFENIAMSEEHEQICRTMLLVHYKPNETIVKQGDVGDSFFHILTGIVKIVVTKKLDYGVNSVNSDYTIEVNNEIRSEILRRLESRTGLWRTFTFIWNKEVRHYYCCHTYLFDKN